ncbi:MAG: PKD domain-containing protein, partial [Nocardioides sp.]
MLDVHPNPLASQGSAMLISRTLGAVVATLLCSSTAAVIPTAALAVPPLAVAAPPPPAPGVSAHYEMNEAAGTTIMQDSGPNGLAAPVDPSGVASGVTSTGATGYEWAYRPPELAPPSPERVIQIPDNPALEPGAGPFTVELRYRTSNSFGNITQKGQSASPGGQWKVQAPGGVPSCLFKGSAGQVATSAITPVDDEAWHNITCAYTSTGVTMYVDGEYRSRKNGTAGTIDNSIPMTIGGKLNCNQVEVTCDYFSGGIDFIKITQAANLAPTAAFAESCVGQVCNFDSSAAADADGSLTRFLWDFGDGTTSTEANPQHTYLSAGSYAVRLTVTDNQAATGVEERTLVVEPDPPLESPVDHVASVMSAANNAAPRVVVPSSAVPGDRLIMVLGYNNLARAVSAPTGVTGWTQLDAVTAGTMGSVAWTKVVAPGDPGAAVTVPLSGSAKYNLSLAAYTGTAPGSVGFARTTDAIPNTSRATPTVEVPTGAWVASYWSDKSGTTATWAPEASVTTRVAGCNADGGRICSLLADSGGPLPGLPYGHVTATTNAASDSAAVWSFVLAPDVEGNLPPSATFSPSCTLLVCSFDGTGSSDPDGSVVSYQWDFGDGSSSTESAPSHTFVEPGTYDVSLTVTDNEGGLDGTVRTVSVVGPPVDSSVDYVDSTVSAGTSATPTVSVPAAAVVGDRLLLAMSLNNTSRTVTNPTGPGWALLDNVVAGD